MSHPADEIRVTVLGRDDIGVIATDGSFAYYLTPCCGATAKGLENYVGCRKCYREIDPALGGVPDSDMIFDGTKTGADRIRFVKRPIDFTEVYGDGLPYDVWRARTFGAST